MPDKEKVIKELMKLHGTKETMTVIFDAIVLLKEQKPVKPISYYHGLDRPFTYRCGHCLHSLKDGDYFCSGCGKEIDWE